MILNRSSKYCGIGIAVIRKIVLVGDDVPAHVNEKGIVIMNVVDFMKDPGSLKSIRSASKV